MSETGIEMGFPDGIFEVLFLHIVRDTLLNISLEPKSGSWSLGPSYNAWTIFEISVSVRNDFDDFLKFVVLPMGLEICKFRSKAIFPWRTKKVKRSVVEKRTEHGENRVTHGRYREQPMFGRTIFSLKNERCLCRSQSLHIISNV